MDDTEKVLDKVRKLLAKGESTNSREEAEACFAKASELIEKYTIDDALLRQMKNGDAAKDISDMEIDVSGAYHIGLRDMAVSVGDALGFTPLLRKRGGKKYVVWVGFVQDLAMADVLWTSLRLQCDRFAMQHMYRFVPEDPLDDRAERFYERRSFMSGFGQAVGDRIKTARQNVRDEAVEEHGNSMALALLDRDAEVEKWAVEKFRPRKSRTRGGQVSWGGFRAGQEAANRADIGQRGRINR